MHHFPLLRFRSIIEYLWRVRANTLNLFIILPKRLIEAAAARAIATPALPLANHMIISVRAQGCISLDGLMLASILALVYAIS